MSVGFIGRLALVFTIALSLAGEAGAGTRTVPPCRSSSLAGSFGAIPGSNGMGSVSYALRLHNISKRVCLVSGLPSMMLLDAQGKNLPTHVYAADNRTPAARPVAPNAYLTASARFSPDMPAGGEPTSGECEPKATHVRVVVQPGPATLVAPVVPATPVCGHGAMSVTGFVFGRTPPTS